MKSTDGNDTAFRVNVLITVVVFSMLFVGIFTLEHYRKANAPTYTVTDHAGNVYRNVEHVDGGFGWAKFRDSDGRTITVRGNYSYREEPE